MTTDVGGGSLQERHMANVYEDAQESISSAQQKLADMAARDARRLEIARQQEAELAALAAAQARNNTMSLLAKQGIVGADAVDAERQARQAAQSRAMMVGTPEMGFTPGQLASGPGAYFARYGPNAPAVLEYIDSPNPLGNVLSAITGLNTPQENLRLGLGQPVFNSRGKLMGELSTNAFGGVVYGGNRFDPGEDHPFRDIIAPGPGHGGYDSSHEDQYDMVPPVTNPATGREECPDGYIFDPDLNACRLDTRSGTTTAPTAPTAPVTPGEMYARTGLLDVAPEGLMGFRERYGAGFGTPSDFGAANLAFRQQAAISPEYFQTPPKLTGYTLL